MLVNEYRLEIQFKKVGKVQNINNIPMISSLYVCMAVKYIIVLFVEKHHVNLLLQSF